MNERVSEMEKAVYVFQKSNDLHKKLNSQASAIFSSTTYYKKASIITIFDDPSHFSIFFSYRFIVYA